MKTPLLIAVGVLLIALVPAACRLLIDERSPAVELDPARLAALESFDDADLTEVLERFVDAQGQVDYPGLLAGRGPLDRFVALLGAVGPELRPELFPDANSRLAYYLNAYNALVLFNVLESWPLESVDDSKLEFFILARFRVDGRWTNLYDLENRVVRPQFGEPRVHFALNCASRGCPRLPREPFSAERLEQQLARETDRFLHEERNVRVRGEELSLSELFDWFSEDFEPDPLTWIRAAAPDLELPAHGTLRFEPWDWSLNQQPPR